MKTRLFVIAILSLLLISFAAGCVATVRTAPPPVRMEVRPAPPPYDAVWIGGYWQHNYGEWVWIPGHWEARPRPAAVWVPGHWQETPRGWHWVPGHWRH